MHSYVGDWVRALVLAHVLSAFAFAVLHGPSVAILWRLRTERSLPRVQALLDMSRAWSTYSWVGWVALAVTGVALALAEHTWRAPWVWGSALVLVVVSLAMSPLAARPFNEARHAAGLPYFDGRGMTRAGPVDDKELEVALGVIRRRSALIAAVGVVGLAVLVWLMVSRPS